MYVLSIATTLKSYAHCSRYLARVSAQSKPTLLASDSRPLLGDNNPVVSVSVLPLTNIKVVDIYFFVWSLSKLLCCVGSCSNVVAALYVERLRAVPRHCVLYPGIRLTTEEKSTGKNLSQGGRKLPGGHDSMCRR